MLLLQLDVIGSIRQNEFNNVKMKKEEEAEEGDEEKGGYAQNGHPLIRVQDKFFGDVGTSLFRTSSLSNSLSLSLILSLLKRQRHLRGGRV